MRKYLLAAVAMAAIASPSLARDGSPYVGIEAGVAMSDEGFLDVDFNDNEFQSGLNTNYNLGMDADIIGGMDFGMFRVEAELGYKRFSIKNIDASGPLLNAINVIAVPDLTDNDLDFSERVTVLSLMGNALLDFGGDTGLGAYVGGGFGRARVKMLGDQDSSWAWQGIAGIRIPIASQFDAGLKYRYFNSGKLRFTDHFDADDLFDVAVEGRFKSRSLLASLIYNFGAPPAPPLPPMVVAPPPPPPPATQTCPDGSVILATDMCPAPPPPPPPPPPAPERG